MPFFNSNSTTEKSLKERFLLVIGIVFFLMYLVMGFAIIFWKKIPLDMSFGYRVSLGSILIVYAFVRFIRFFQK